MDTVLFGQQISKEIFNFSHRYTEHLSKPQQGNFRELLRGILSTGSTHLQTMAKSSGGGHHLRKDVERLSRALECIPAEEFTKLHIAHQTGAFKNEPVLLLSDGGDIQKPSARKMEGVASVVDGSHGHKSGRGYPLHGLVAYGLTSQAQVPLSLHLFSRHSRDYKGDWDEQKKVMNMLPPFIHGSSYDRIVVEDRGCDDEQRFLYYVHDRHCSFVTRLCGGTTARHVLTVDTDGHEKKESVETLALHYQEQAKAPRIWHNKKTKQKLTSHILWKQVFLPGHTELPLYLIAVFTDGYDTPMLLLTNLITETPEAAWKHFFYYKKRWEVENFFRALKQNFSAEEFRILALKKIKALLFLLLLAMSFLHLFLQKMKQFSLLIFTCFTEYCHREQRSGTHHLDLAAFFKVFLSPQKEQYSYRFFSQYFHVIRSYQNKNQLKLFRDSKNW